MNIASSEMNGAGEVKPQGADTPPPLDAAKAGRNHLNK